MHTDPIADMLTRIRNAQMIKKSEVTLPYSKLKLNIVKLLESEKWLGKVEILEPQLESNAKAKNQKDIDAKFKQIKIEILYNNKEPKITNIKKISTPGQRVYAGKDEMPVVLNNYGISVVSTSKGLMTNKQAKKENIGGEILCEVY